ncbi:hypothetical protein LIA77_01861 [Sarocladium implicatum]|nr:hypothetical protein LIA77_01861 [Sarocladium implicatum]
MLEFVWDLRQRFLELTVNGRGCRDGLENGCWSEEGGEREAWDEGDEMGDVESEEDAGEGEGGDPGAGGGNTLRQAAEDARLRMRMLRQGRGDGRVCGDPVADEGEGGEEEEEEEEGESV